MPLEQKFLFSLCLTLIIEIPTILLLAVYLGWHKKVKIFEIISSGLLASVVTLPYFWFVLPAYISNRNAYILVGESAIIFTETMLYQQLLRIKISQAFFMSLIANISSIVLGSIFIE